MESVKIKSFHFNLEKNLQDFVIFTMKELLKIQAIPKDELENLQNKDYCKKTFDLNYPLLTKDPDQWNEDKNHPRYYSKQRFYVDELYLCNHWFQQDSLFAEWLKKISNIN